MYVNILFLVNLQWMTPAGSTTSVTVAGWGFSISVMLSTLIGWLSIVRKSLSLCHVYLYQQEHKDSYFIILSIIIYFDVQFSEIWPAGRPSGLLTMYPSFINYFLTFGHNEIF